MTKPRFWMAISAALAALLCLLLSSPTILRGQSDNMTVLDATSTTQTVAMDLVSGVLYQRYKRSAGADGSATDFLDKSSRSDTFTAPGSGTTVNVSAQAMSRYSLQVVQTGTVTSWTVVLEASNDGTNFATILTHTNTTGSGAMVFTGASRYPALYFRARCSALTLGGGTNVIATIVGMP